MFIKGESYQRKSLEVHWNKPSVWQKSAKVGNSLILHFGSGAASFDSCIFWLITSHHPLNWDSQSFKCGW